LLLQNTSLTPNMHTTELAVAAARCTRGARERVYLQSCRRIAKLCTRCHWFAQPSSWRRRGSDGPGCGLFLLRSRRNKDARIARVPPTDAESSAGIDSNLRIRASLQHIRASSANSSAPAPHCARVRRCYCHFLRGTHTTTRR
jgi:hypothetical protein